VAIGLAAGCYHTAEHPPAPPPAAAAIGAEVVQVAPPTGVREADRGSILAALAQVQPGGTIQFAPGTYLIGEIVSVTTPRITLLGHPQGTTLRGCDPAGYEEMEWAASRAERDWRVLFPIVRSCGTFELSGGHSTIRGLTFEYTRMGVVLGCCHADREHRPAEGGYLVEGNTFRNSGNGIRPGMLSAAPTVIRGNTFINTFHAVSAFGGHLHILENDISVPEPHRVPGVGHPSFAIALCGEHNVIEGNRIDGHPDGVLLIADPGAACRENVIRDNTITVRRVPFSATRPYQDMPLITDEADSTIVGVPLLLYAITGEEEKGIVEANRIEGNRLLGSDGIALEVVGASRNRFVGNTITGVVVRTAFPGNTLGSNAGWKAANGAGIWLSSGSNENEIVGNVFEDIASHAIVIEGDNNRVTTRGAIDAVRDLGSGNRMEQAFYQSGFVETRGIRLHYLDFGGAGLPLIFVHDWYEDAHTVHVAPPTGDREADRASILAALERVRPGGTVQFAPGTYLVGELIPIETPRITLQGHPRETTLRACEPDEYHEMELAVAGASADDEAWAAVTLCGMFMLTGGHVTIRGFTFEYTRLGLLLGCCHRGGVMRPTDGGYRIEGNTFQHLGNGIRVMLDSPVPSVIRGNQFINVFHALSAPQVSHLHFVDNDMSVPDPRSVPAMGYPSFAVAINALGRAASCEHNLVAGNRIQGHPIGIKIATGPGSTCRYNVIRDNTIIASRVPLPATRIYDFEPLITNESDSTFFGVPLQLLNEVDASGQSGVLEDNLIEGNRVIGAQGLSIFVWRASRNRIAENTITGVAALDPFPGNVLGFPYPESPAANGSAIWLSPGSDENEIVGNTFTDIAAHAVVLEGDRNRVEPRTASDAVRDLGSGNRVTVPGIRPPVQGGSDSIRNRFFHSDGLRLHYLDFGGEGLPLVFVPALDRTADTFRDFAPRFTDRHRVLAITNRGSGQSQGETRDQWDTAGRARDVIALLDTLGIQHAVTVGRWEDVPIYLAENHAERVAGLVILSPQEIGPSRQTLRAHDSTGVVGMVDRWALTAVWGFDPDQPAPWDDAYAPQSNTVIGVPTLVFRGAESRGRGAADLSLPLALAELAYADRERFPDAVSRSWFQRLRADPALQAEVRAFYENVVDSAFAASERAFLEAFGDRLRIVRLDLEEPITGYEYRDLPELYEAHIRSFLEEISTGQRDLAGERR
jgi:pimeloyl-ACP methyl ester carboxylesterase